MINLVMLACAACAREKQHLLGQLLKETEINWNYLKGGFKSPFPHVSEWRIFTSTAQDLHFLNNRKEA